MQIAIGDVRFSEIEGRPVTPQTQANVNIAIPAAGRTTRWRRNQSCDSVVEGGAVACVLSGAVRKFALQPDGQRQIIDLMIIGDCMGFAPADPAFVLEAVVDDTLIVSFASDEIDALAARFPAVGAAMRGCAGEVIRRLEHQLLTQSQISARERGGAYLAGQAQGAGGALWRS